MGIAHKKHEPKLRSFEDGHRQASWSELFYDLAFVVVIGQVVHHLVKHPNLSGALIYVTVFIPVWWCWINEVFYTTRFDNHFDRVKRFLGTVQLISLLVLSVVISKNVEEHSTLFFAGYALIRSFQIIEIARAGWYVNKAQSLIKYFALGHSVGVTLCWLSLMLSGNEQLLVFGAGFLIEVLVSFRARRLNQEFPPHISHLPERFGLFTILVLGESFIGTVNGASETQITLSLLAYITLGILIAVGIWWTYFDRLDIEAIKMLKEEKLQMPFFIWLFAHLPLTAAIAGVGAGIELNIAQHELSPGLFTIQILPVCASIYMLFEAVICATSVGAGKPKMAFSKGVYARIVCGILTIGVSLFTPTGIPMMLIVVAFIWAVVLADFFLERKNV